MPGLKYIMEQAVHPDLRLLRGKTIECISQIVLAVGKEKFMQDANSIMTLFMKTQKSAESAGDTGSNEEQFADDDPQVSYICCLFMYFYFLSFFTSRVIRLSLFKSGHGLFYWQAFAGVTHGQKFGVV